MKNFFYVFLLFLLMAFSFLLLSCGGNEKVTDFSKVSYTIDTVVVDSKGEILSLKGDLMNSDLSSDSKYLYYLNPMNLNLEIVGLDQLEFVRRVSYEIEGPNGLGEFPMHFQALSDEQLFIGSFTHRGIFDLNGNKIKNLNFKMDELKGDKILPGYFEKTLIADTRNQNKLFSVLNFWGHELSLFGIIDTQTKTFEDLPVPELDYLAEFRMIFSDGGTHRAVVGEQMELSDANNKIILSNNISSDLYVFDLKDENLEHKLFDHQSIPSRKSIKLPAIVESMGELHEYNRKLGEDINFTAPVWDAENQIYYRFAYFMKNKEVNGKQETDGAEVFLIVLDKDFHLMSETLVETYNKIPSRHFVKDGKIWIFENVEDEMGFVRLSLD